MDKSNKLMLKWIVALFLAGGIVCLFLSCSSTETPRVHFSGMRQKAVLYDDWFECPNGDGIDVRAYQLDRVDVHKWIEQRNPRKEKWVRGPLHDHRYAKAFGWSNQTSEDKEYPPHWPYEQWLKSDQFYFYLLDYEEFNDNDMGGTVHHSTIWALDAKYCRLYYVSGSI